MTLGDRIVIMKDGVIQQIGTPQQVFDHPSNLFVASFIGTPQMNLFDARLTRSGDKYAVESGGLKVELSDAKNQRLAAKDVKDQAITLGVRPEHLVLDENGIEGTIDVAELMGSSTHLHISSFGKDIVAIAANETGQVNRFPIGTSVHLTFSGSNAHVFDPETGKNLEW